MGNGGQLSYQQVCRDRQCDQQNSHRTELRVKGRNTETGVKPKKGIFEYKVVSNLGRLKDDTAGIQSVDGQAQERNRPSEPRHEINI